MILGFLVSKDEYESNQMCMNNSYDVDHQIVSVIPKRNEK